MAVVLVMALTMAWELKAWADSEISSKFDVCNGCRPEKYGDWPGVAREVEDEVGVERPKEALWERV